MALIVNGILVCWIESWLTLIAGGLYLDRNSLETKFTAFTTFHCLMLISVILSRQPPDDAKVFGEIYCEKDDVTLGKERE